MDEAERGETARAEAGARGERLNLYLGVYRMDRVFCIYEAYCLLFRLSVYEKKRIAGRGG